MYGCSDKVGCVRIKAQEPLERDGIIIMKKQVIVIGGGSSGLMAACTAAEFGASVTLIEKNKNLGKKLILTGGGRCNVTNNRSEEEIIAHIPGNGRFLHSAFNQFNQFDIMNYFTSRGVALKEEDHGRMFPVTDKARTILETFIEELKNQNVTVRTNAIVEKILFSENHEVTGVKLDTGEELPADSIVLATGGKSLPRTGSTGDGYRFAKKAGHTITELYPTEAPITSPETFISERILKGLSLRNVALSVLNKKGKKVTTHQMDMIFTHFGVSGPAALRCSMFIHQTKKRDKTDVVTMSLDLFPDKSLAQVEQQMNRLIKDAPDKSVKNGWKDLMPERYLLFGLEKCEIDANQTLKSLTPKEIQAFAAFCKAFNFQADGTHPLDKAFVTGGGVSTKEVNPKTMESKMTKGLYFCGELLDYNGYTGGYNITGAFVTGHTAGYHAAIESK